jgi:hypothetical protein
MPKGFAQDLTELEAPQAVGAGAPAPGRGQGKRGRGRSGGRASRDGG